MNKTIISIFSNLKINTSNKHKINAYEKIINTLSSLPYEINLDNYKDLINIKNIGSHTIQRIEEILKTGSLKELNNMSSLLSIFGIGPSLANKYNKYTPRQLHNLHKKNKITLPHSVIIGLKYHNKINTHIPHKTLIFLDNYLSKISNTLNITYSLCGSYRRLTEYSSDIDVLISSKHNSLKQFITHLHNSKFIVEDLTQNYKTKYMGLCTYNDDIYRIDIRYIKPSSYPFALLYFTGSREFNKKMRYVAKSYNYKLNEYGLYNSLNKSIKAKTENDIFKHLGMQYVEPQLRTA